MFTHKTLLITGGTGSFGNAVLRRFLDSELREIRIFSRDEKKQDDMRKRFNSGKLKFYLGDVREPRSVAAVMRGVDYVFHAAVLKQVPSCEFHPMEAVRTNVLGTENVLEAAIAAGVQRVICLSTDKAVYPINAMGISKAMMEKVMVARQPQPRRHQHRDLRHTLRQCDGLARLGHPLVCGAGAVRPAHHDHRPGYDALHDDAGRRRRAGAVRL